MLSDVLQRSATNLDPYPVKSFWILIQLVTIYISISLDLIISPPCHSILADVLIHSSSQNTAPQREVHFHTIFHTKEVNKKIVYYC